MIASNEKTIKFHKKFIFKEQECFKVQVKKVGGAMNPAMGQKTVIIMSTFYSICTGSIFKYSEQ